MALVEVVQWAERLFASISGYLTALVIALVILLLGFILGRIVDRALHKGLLKADLDARLGKLLKRRRNYARATRVTIVRLIYLATALIALERINASGIAVAVVLGAFVLIALLSLAVAGIDIVPNLLARSALRRKGLKEGDDIEIVGDTGSVRGRIVDMTLTDVHVKRSGGDVLYIPNASFLRNRIIKRR